MKRKEVLIGIAIAVVILIVTLIVHWFFFKLPYVLVSSVIIFSALLFTLCIIGDKKRKQKEKTQRSGDK